MWFNGEPNFWRQKTGRRKFEQVPGQRVANLEIGKTAKSLLKQNAGQTTKETRNQGGEETITQRTWGTQRQNDFQTSVGCTGAAERRRYSEAGAEFILSEGGAPRPPVLLGRGDVGIRVFVGFPARAATI
jgi:hypothetical protein